MAPADLVGIFTYTPINGIQMAANFTSDTGLLLTALDDLGLDKSKHTIDGPAGYFLSELLNDFQRRLATGGSGRG